MAPKKNRGSSRGPAPRRVPGTALTSYYPQLPRKPAATTLVVNLPSGGNLRSALSKLGAPQPPKGQAKLRKKKSQGAPGAARKGRRMALHHMHPASNLPVPGPFCSGNAFVSRGFTRTQVQIPIVAGTTTFVFVTNTGCSATIGILMRVTNSATIPTGYPINMPTIQSDDDSGGPTSGRAMKAGIQLINNTPKNNRGGAATYIPLDARFKLPSLPSLMTGAQWSSVANTLRSQPDTFPFDLSYLGRMKNFCVSVAEVQSYTAFHAWSGIEDLDDFMRHCATWPGSAHLPRPMTTGVIIFDSPQIEQTLSLVARSAFYTRWAVDTVPGQHMVPLPTATPAAIDAIYRGGARLAKSIHEDEHVAGIASGIATAGAAWAGSRLYNGYQGLGRMGQATTFGEFGAGAAEAAEILELAPLLIP